MIKNASTNRKKNTRVMALNIRRNQIEKRVKEKEIKREWGDNVINEVMFLFRFWWMSSVWTTATTTTNKREEKQQQQNKKAILLWGCFETKL